MTPLTPLEADLRIHIFLPVTRMHIRFTIYPDGIERDKHRHMYARDKYGKWHRTTKRAIKLERERHGH